MPSELSLVRTHTTTQSATTQGLRTLKSDPRTGGVPGPRLWWLPTVLEPEPLPAAQNLALPPPTAEVLPFDKKKNMFDSTWYTCSLRPLFPLFSVHRPTDEGEKAKKTKQMENKVMDPGPGSYACTSYPK